MAEYPILPQTDAEKLGALIKQVDQAILKVRNRIMSDFDLTASQADILHYIQCNEDHEINQVELERYFHLTNPTVTGILKRLESKGFIEKKPSIKDSRHKSICQTERGRAVMTSGIANKQLIEDTLTNGMSREEIDSVLASLSRMLDNMDRISD